MKKKIDIGKVIIVVVMCVATVILSINAIYMNKVTAEIQQNTETGKKLVETLYEYNDLKQLGDNQEVLKELVTEEVFDKLNVDAKERGLRVYLKFRGGPVRVVIDEVGRDFVMYHVENEHIEEWRTFVMFYRLGTDGKVNWVREGELHDF